MGGQPVRDLDDLLILLNGDRDGRSVPIRIVRGGQISEVRVVVGEQE